VKIVLHETDPRHRALMLRMLEIMGHTVVYYDDSGHRDMMSAVEHNQPDLLIACVEEQADLESLLNVRLFSGNLFILPIVRNMNSGMFDRCQKAGLKLVLSKPVLYVELEKFCTLMVEHNKGNREALIIDEVAFLDVMQGGGERAVDILENFCRDCQKSIVGMQSLLQEDPADHREEIREISHRLKGSAGMFAFRALQKEMESLEKRASGTEPIAVEEGWNDRLTGLLEDSREEAMALLNK